VRFFSESNGIVKDITAGYCEVQLC